MKRRFGIQLAFLAAAALTAIPATAQFVTQPPSGDNQRAEVVQNIGLVRVSIEYSSPHVHNAAGDDRKGQIWGKLVPYGMANLGFGTCGANCPWRGGANENTVFTTSHDIRVQGQKLPAGRYGLSFIPEKDAEWTIIFSKNSTAWGSFFYDAKDDALRVKAKPEAAEYHEVLAYEFPERKNDTATAALAWENLRLPFVITVDDWTGLYVDKISQELQSMPGFTWEGRDQAAQFAMKYKTHLDLALRWAEESVNPALSGQENFTTLSTLARAQAANGKTAEAKATMDKAIRNPSAGPVDLHLYGRQLLADKKTQEALAVFELNAKLHPNVWPVHVGLGRGYAAVGRTKEAISELEKAEAQAPDKANKENLANLVEKLKAGKTID